MGWNKVVVDDADDDDDDDGDGDGDKGSVVSSSFTIKVELHPYLPQVSLLAFCQEHRIQLTA